MYLYFSGSSEEMTYHMESMALKNNSVKKLLTPEVGEPISISPKTTERRITFPERLWECVNDATDLVKWSPKGNSVLVEEERFEKEVYIAIMIWI